MWACWGRTEGNQIAAEGLARYDEGGYRRKGEERRRLGDIVLVTCWDDGVLWDLVDDLGTLTSHLGEHFVYCIGFQVIPSCISNLL